MSAAELDALIEETTVDTYDEIEAVNGFLAVIDSRVMSSYPRAAYVREEPITPLPIRRLAAAHPMTVDTVFRRLLRQPGFAWSEYDEALLRRQVLVLRERAAPRSLRDR